MTTFLTGVTGFLGGYLAHRLLAAGEDVTALVRAADPVAARMRLWKNLQLHMPANTLRDHLDAGRLKFLLGDIRAPRLGLEPALYERLVAEHDGVVHAAASLNRRSPSSCFDVNLRGGLTLHQLAADVHRAGHLRRYTFVSTVAIAGRLQDRILPEDEAIDWGRSDWDPYARTKKFGEHLVEQLLADASVVVVRPSIVMGDSRFPETTQFDMVRAFVGLAKLPVLPFEPSARLDIVPADFVADAAAALHMAEAPKHRAYHLSAGAESPDFAQITDRLVEALGHRRTRFVPRASKACALGLRVLAEVRHPLLKPVRGGAALMDAFWPYLEWDVVFDNQRVVSETGLRPASFLDYAPGLFRFATNGNFRFPHRPLPPILADCDAGAWGPAAVVAARGGC
jgi:thioester reductase-like protein